MLEQALTALMTPMKDAPRDIAKIQQKVDKIMYKEFDDALQKIDHATGNITFAEPDKDYIGQSRKNDIKDIVDRINRLENELKRQIGQGGFVDDTALQVVEILKETYEEAYNEVQRFQQENGLSSSAAFKQVFNDDLALARETLNELIQEYAAFPNIGTQKGRLFEHLIRYAPKVLDQSADAAIGQLIGNITGDVSYNMEAFDSYYTAHNNINGVLTTTHASQGKIDVTIDWQGQELNISAKNVNLEKDWIRLVTGSSLLYLLQDEDSQFVNHFLNIFATHGRKGSNQASLAAYRKTIIEDVKLILFYKALTGDTYGRKAANLLVVNDNRLGHVKVYSIATLIDRVARQPIKGVQFNGKTFNTSTNLKNTWHKESAQARISALLADAHAKKVNVSISTKYL